MSLPDFDPIPGMDPRPGMYSLERWNQPAIARALFERDIARRWGADAVLLFAAPENGRPGYLRISLPKDRP